MKGNIETDTVRYVQSNLVTRLLAFDANLEGNGFGFGDGKAGNYYVDGWKSKDQKISWTFRMLKPAAFKVVIKYVATPESEGSYQMDIGSNSFREKVVPSLKGNTIVTKELGTISLATMDKIIISPVEIIKPELMKLLEVQLIPVDIKK